MARRRRKKEELDPLQAFVLLLMLVSGWGVYSYTTSIVAAGVTAGAIMAGYAFVIASINRKQTERLKRSGIAEIDKMEGRQFEKYLGHVFRAHGYVVEVTQAAGDYGADLVISKAGKKIVVQAKRYSKNVGLKAVQEVHTALNHYGASEAWVVTNSDYTGQAYTLAKSNGVRLIMRQQLIELILTMNPELQVSLTDQLQQPPISAEQEVAASIEPAEPDDLDCPQCGYLLVKRNGKRGEFYGCSNFPKCRHTMDIA
ncbi:restriction endonuclease [Paenibacillus sinopodophylli]|uniref:restriction endonuclease n=1 Tax=Paenibacillus sinopodophylli TaxID=1837342 RepID=UPI00110C8E17|nr:restriction endonuclease [Paenibacillus sinopodophylli]